MLRVTTLRERTRPPTTMAMMTMAMTGTMTTTQGMTMAEHRSRAGFRTRVLGSFVALVAGASFAGLFFQRAVLLERLDREVDRELEQERSELQSLAAGSNPSTGEPFGADVRAIFDTFLRRNLPLEGEVYLTFVDGAPHKSTPAPVRLDEDPTLVARWASVTTGEWGRLATDEGPVRYLAVPLRFDGRTHGVFVVANFVQSERDEIESSVRVAGVVAAGILVLATAVAWFVAGRLLRPVRQLTEAAEGISDTDLERRIPVEGNDEIARLAQRFNEMLDRLAGAFAAQRAFVDDAGHELRTPITIVRGHLELMGDDPDERRETVALVTDELDRMTRIVEDLLVLAKAEQPDFVRPEPVEVADLTSELLVKARTLGEREWRLDACATGEIDADRQRVTQAMLNLARNAVEHSPPDAQVAVGSAWRGDVLRLWVRDSGPGVDPGEQERIFDRFARGRSGRRRSEGAGLGLAIVRTVAEAHGGRVELDSRPGHGATFTIMLPAHHLDRPSLSPATDEPATDARNLNEETAT
jgi:two-component system, OmpR family, sensor kinase